MRDKYPIFCQNCGTEILGGYVAPDGVYYHGESYRVIGLVQIEDGSFTSVYQHTPTCPPYSSVRHDPLAAEPVLTRPHKERRTKEKHQNFSSVKAEKHIAHLKVIRTSADENTQPPKTSQDAVRQFLADIRANREKLGELGDLAGEATNDRKSHTPTEKEMILDLVGDNPITNEQAVVFAFGRMADRLGYKLLRMNSFYPDAVFLSPDGIKITVEFEYKSSNFVLHRHNPALTDLVVCMYKDSRLPVPVLALADI
jgi:hypothetical protein